MSKKKQGPSLQIAFEILFSPVQLFEEYKRKHANSKSRGLDRANGSQYGEHLPNELEAISRKCLNSTYRFTPYLEILKVKSRESAPRMISIPTIRDRIVLGQLNKLLRLAFSTEARSPLASTYVRYLSAELSGLDPAANWTAGSDIKRFYDSIDRDRLLKLVGDRIMEKQIVGLLASALMTPTVPKNYRVKDTSQYKNHKGVPQGLAISNALAAIYLYEVDEAMRQMPIKYFRFVDDILIVGGKEETIKAQRSFAARVRARSLSVHSSGAKKGHHLPLTSKFSYLGYVFCFPAITIREATVERLLHSLAAKISDYSHNKDAILRRKPYLTSETLREVFLEELSERVSGAISESRRYGWIAYFSEITDLSVLYKLDGALAAMVSRVPEFRASPPILKRFARAFFEIKYRPEAGYVRNYDAIKTPVQMIKFLEFRGQMGPGEKLTEGQIRGRFVAYRDLQLSRMLADEGVIY